MEMQEGKPKIRYIISLEFGFLVSFNKGLCKEPFFAYHTDYLAS